MTRRFTSTALLLSFCSLLTLMPAHAQEPLQEPAAGNNNERTAGAMPGVSDTSETYRQLNLFGEVFERVREQYVDEVPDKKLIEDAVNGMLMALDPHSAYLNEEDFGDMQIQTKGEFGGLGIEVTMENGVVKVVSPIDDTPAFRAGLKSGDYITHLDGQPIVGMALNDAIDKMRGKVGTSIKLTIRREGVADPIEVDIVRDIIKISSIKHEVMDENIGYIRITTFNQNTDENLKKAITAIKEKTGTKLLGYILDLRNNPGGLLDQAIAVADEFLDKGEIVSTRGRHEQDTKRDNATSGDMTGGLPVVVLINEGSASASEIVAGALKDHRRAIVLGTKSFGKGSVQTIVPLPGHGAMRLTTARYYTPSGHSIQAKGIEPDIVVEQAKIESLGDRRRYSEADLPGALENPEDTQKKKTLPPTDPEDPETEKKSDPPDTKDNGEPAPDKDGDKTKEEDKDEEKDYQLLRAKDLLRGVSLYKERLNESGEATVVPAPLPADPAPAPEKTGE